MSYNPTSAGRRRSGKRLVRKSHADYRRLFNRILASSGEGRITLAVFKDIARILQRFYGCRTIEIIYRENHKFLHVKTVRGRSTRTSGWKEVWVDDADCCDFFETVPLDVCRCFKTHTQAEKGKKNEGRRVYCFATDNRSVAAASENQAVHYLFLGIPAGRSENGVLVMSFARSRFVDRTAKDLLNRLASIIGLTVSHNLSRFELRERVKELTCMYSIANLAVSSGQSVDTFLQQTAELLPPAYLYPEITEARILFDGNSYATDGFVETAQSQTAVVVIGGLERGMVEVVYREPRPEMDEGPFLKEERHLLDSVAREVALIIERKQAEIEHGRLQEQLRHADRLATIGKLAAGVAHELNEPLTGILGFSELLKEFPGMPPDALKDVERIESAALHGREVVRKLLLFARQISPRQRTVCINRLAREVAAFLKERCRQQDIRIQTQLDPALPPISADESQIRQVIMNLLVNALQAMENGGRLIIGTQSSADRITIYVQDTGGGIPDEIRDKIFLPFFTTKEVHEGTGIGLSVVHGIVKSHDGGIDVFNLPGGGTEFRVWLPANPAPKNGTLSQATVMD